MPPRRRRKTFLNALVVAASIAAGALLGTTVYRLGVDTLLARIGDNATTLLALTDSYVSTYSQAIDHATNGSAPVPAAYRASAARRFNGDRHHDDQPVAVMVGMPGREIATPPTDAVLAGMLASMLRDGKPARRDELLELNGVPTLRTVFASIATDGSCVDCHNRLQPHGTAWAVGDMMGAYVVDSNVGRELSGLQRYAVSLGVLTAAVCCLAGLLLRYYRRLIAQRRELRVLASTDPLTRCLNRRALAEAYRDGLGAEPGCLLILDIDHFKRINDRHGHDAGDAVLVQFAERVRRELRVDDVLARIGGEEFVVLARGTSAAQARELAHRLRRAVAATPFEVHGDTLRVTTSLGGLEVPHASSPTLEQLMTRADAYLYQAKRLGRDRVLLPRALELAR